jgi:hypothetical protein
MQGIYLYCICKSDSLTGIEGNGIDEKYPVFLHPMQRLSAAVSQVTLSDFIGPESEANFKELSWIAPRALRHEEIIELIMLQSPVLPVRFGSVFSNLEQLENALIRHHDTILNFLNDISDKEEWTLKGFMDRELAKKTLLKDILLEKGVEYAALSQGVRYLKEQKLKATVEKDLQVWLKKICGDITVAVKDLAVNYCERRLLSKTETGAELDMVFNTAFLLQKNGLDSFKEKVEQLNRNYEQNGLVLELTGPWSPYSFSPQLEQEADE